MDFLSSCVLVSDPGFHCICLILRWTDCVFCIYVIYYCQSFAIFSESELYRYTHTHTCILVCIHTHTHTGNSLSSLVCMYSVVEHDMRYHLVSNSLGSQHCPDKGMLQPFDFGYAVCVLQPSWFWKESKTWMTVHSFWRATASLTSFVKLNLKFLCCSFSELRWEQMWHDL